MLKVIAGAVINVCDHHGLQRDRKFARSVAKRAVGTLTASWPDVLAAKETRRRHNGSGEIVRSPDLGGSHPVRRPSRRGPSQRLRRSPLCKAWMKVSSEMCKYKHGLMSIEDYEANIRVLKILQRLIDESE